MNIGLQCNESDLACTNNYITLYSFDLNSALQTIEIKMINLNPKFGDICDAILSQDESFIFLLANVGTNVNTSMVIIYIIELSQLSVISEIKPYIIRGKIFPLKCQRIIQYSDFNFIIHCISIEYEKALEPTRCQNIKEIFYFVEFLSDTIRELFYIDF